MQDFIDYARLFFRWIGISILPVTIPSLQVDRIQSIDFATHIFLPDIFHKYTSQYNHIDITDHGDLLRL